MTTLLTLLFQWISLVSVISSTIVSAKPYEPRFSVFGGTNLQDTGTKPQANTKKISKDFKTFFYTQTLDHFNYMPQSYATFKQRYVINFKYWGGAKERAPILVHLGAEDPLDKDISHTDFLTDNAPRLKALLIYIEHRYYGKSIPFGSIEKVIKNATIRGFFNSAQALADYAEIIIYLKKKLSAHHSPVIVIGGSYGGMLASWFRLKYPHIALGALASSAPILYYDDLIPQNGYDSVVTKNYKGASVSCFQTIKKSWSEIDKVASQQNGVSILSQRFKTCTHLTNSSELKDYLKGIYTIAAQYNRPPKYPVTRICRSIDGASKGTDILGRIFAGVVADQGKKSCYDTKPRKPTPAEVAYGWQTCSEDISPVGVIGGSDTMFQPSPFNLKNYTEDCYKEYGVRPRPHWFTTYYGGHDIKLVLKRFGSNIIFSNGLTDPYSIGGILEDISDTILAIHTPKGSHCLDLDGAKKSDPDWLVKQRQKEIEIIKRWIKKYFDDLSSMQKKI